MKYPAITEAWTKRQSVRDGASVLYAEGQKVTLSGKRLCREAEGMTCDHRVSEIASRIEAEGHLMCHNAITLMADADAAYSEAVVSAYGTDSEWSRASGEITA